MKRHKNKAKNKYKRTPGVKLLTREIAKRLSSCHLKRNEDFLRGYREGRFNSYSVHEFKCGECGRGVETSLQAIWRHINKKGDQVPLCRTCAPRNLNETAIAAAIRSARPGREFVFGRFPVHVFRDDYPEYFEALKPTTRRTRLQIDVLEIDGDLPAEFAYEIHGEYHSKGTRASEVKMFRSERRQLADQIKAAEFHHSLPHLRKLVVIEIVDTDPISANIERAFRQLQAAGVTIDAEGWAEGSREVINTEYRRRVIRAVKRLGAEFIGGIPAQIVQTTKLHLRCANGSVWKPWATTLVKEPCGNCPCPKCGKRRSWYADEISSAAKEWGWNLYKPMPTYSAKDEVSLQCRKCKHTESINVRTFRGWVEKGEGLSCVCCEVRQLIDDYDQLDASGTGGGTQANTRREVLARTKDMRRRYLAETLPSEAMKLLLDSTIDLTPQKVRRTVEEKLFLIEQEAPKAPLNTNNKRVGEYVRYFRKLHRSNKLSAQRIERLISAGVDLGNKPMRTANERLEQMAQFRSRFGRLPTPSEHKGLNQWIKDTRVRVKKGLVKPEVLERFRQLDV